MQQRRRISYAPAPVAPTSFRGTPESVSSESYEYGEDDAATILWQGGRSALPSYTDAPPSQRWNETPMAFEPRVPPPPASVAPMAMDMAAAAPSAPRGDVLAWLPLASVACVGVAIAGLLFAVAITSFRNHDTSSVNASAGAPIANVMPAAAAPVRRATPSLTPVYEPTVSEPISTQTIAPSAPIAMPVPQAQAAQSPATVFVPVEQEPAPRVTHVAPTPKTTPAPTTVAPVMRADRTDRSDRTDRAIAAPVEQPPIKKTAAAPHADDEAASAQKMLEEAQRETSGAL